MLNIWDNNADRYQDEFRKGIIDYEEFCKRDTMLWKGVNVSKVMEILDKIPYHEGVKETVDSLKLMGIYTVIISTGLSLLVNRVKKDLAIDMAFSNDLIVYDGVLKGEVKVNVVFNEKALCVKRVLESLNIMPEEACAVGDGEGIKGCLDGWSARLFLLFR
jgi:phosphoserine phosphatase